MLVPEYARECLSPGQRNPSMGEMVPASRLRLATCCAVCGKYTDECKGHEQENDDGSVDDV